MDGRDPRYETEYYRPYDSADDSGSDSESSSTDSWYSEGMDQEPPPQGVNPEGIPNFRAFATQIQLRDAAGRNFSTVRDQVTYGTNKLSKYTSYSQYDAPPPDLSGEDTYGRTRFATADGSLTSLVLIDSRYRDRQAYPQPTFFTLRLPRIYKQVTNITLSDLKLLTSFYFFRTSKGNTDITVYEKGRTTYNPYTNTTTSTIVKRFITTGSYNIESLLQEVQLQLNYTPLFFDFPGGYSDFYNLFSATGDYSLNFNQPGDFFFNNTTNLWIPRPTVDTIVGYFWKTRFAGLTTYSPNQILLAYYYPVLNEYLFDEDYSNDVLNLKVGLNVLPGLTTTEDVINHILYDFMGISPMPDPVVLAVVNANIAALDEYRIRHTFRYWLINKYVVGRDTRSQNVYITSPSLNTSLVNLLQKQADFYLLQAFQIYGVQNAAGYAALNEAVYRALAVAQAMYDFEQQRFLTYFAVPWTQYTLGYYADLNNTFFLQNGIGATGVPSNPADAQDQGIIPYSTNILFLERNEPPAYWPNMSGLTSNLLPASTISMVNLSTATSSFNLVYDMYNSNFNPRQPIVEAPNDYLYSEYLTKSANVVCPIQPSKYTVFKFRSPVRQTLQIETLPRPTVYRLPAYNQSNFGSTINQYYDLSYAFVTSVPYDQNDLRYAYTYDNLTSTSLFQIPGWASSNTGTSFGTSYLSSINRYTSSLTLDVTTANRSIYTTFTTPNFPGASPASNYTYSLNVSVQFYSNAATGANPPPNQCRMFLYHDRAAFQADVLSNRNENPLFYKASTVITTTDLSGTISFITYPNQQYYVSVRPDDYNYGQTFVRVTPYFNTSIQSTVQTKSIAGLNPETDILSPTFNTLVQSNWNYAQVYDSNWIRLPISPSTLWGASDPSGDPENNTLAIYNVPIGYDSNNVSTDYTDYIPYWSNSVNYGFTPSSNLGIDPITQYIFQSNSPYNSTAQIFLSGSNSVLTPGLRITYTPTLVGERQYKICQYYSPNYIASPDSNFPFNSNLISQASNFQLPYSISTTMNTKIAGYTYGGGAASTLQLGRGVLGFNFIPEEGVWDIKRVVFRSAINDSNNDPNNVIQYLGVYNMSAILSTPTSQLSMCNAIAVLSNSARRTYVNPGTIDDGSFDIKGGTYYEFQANPFHVGPANIPILGYSQTIKTMSDQPESMYTLIAFNQYGVATPITALSGSAVPYPFYNNAYPSTTYLDGTRAYNLNQGVVFPSTIGPVAWPFVSSISSVFGPPTGVDESQAQFALSMPIGTSVLNYKQSLEPVYDTGFVYPWSTIMTPTNVIANVSTFVLLQDTNFNIYRYDDHTVPRAFTNPVWTLTADQIYPTYETTSLVSVAGNSTYFYFLGLSNDNNINFQVRLKRYNPFTGVLYDYNVDPSFNLPLGGVVKGFTINDYEQIVVAYDDTVSQTKLYYNVQPSSIMQTKTINGTSTLTMTMDVTTSTLYYIPLNRTTNQGIATYQWSIDNAGAFPGTSWEPTGTGVPPTWTGLAVNAAYNVPASNDRVTLISQTTGYESNLYYVSNWTTGPNQWQVAKIGTPITNSVGAGQAIGTITNGFRGAIWITAGSTPYVWGTRNTTADVNGLVDSAWQIFYPFQKIILEKTANSYNAIVDQTYIEYPEWPHTAMFYYRDGTKFSNDTTQKWGLEKSSNFYVSDPDMNGYYFNSYIFNVPLVKSLTSNDYQYITVRGYTPTESSETLLRFVLPNKYDFGYATQLDLIDEIALYQNSNTQTQFNSNYGYTLSNFDIAFQQSNSYFGAGYLPNFLGSNLNSSNYASFASNFSTLYGGYQSNAAILSNITTYVASNIQQYISSQLTYIIPSYAIGRNNYLDPILFSILWKSGLLPQYKDLLEDWGLGYNLGYSKIDTPFSTYARAASFYKILEDYIFLRLNPQYQLNRMDNTYRENFKITRDSTGQIKNFHGKLLLNNFNTYSQTFIYNNQPFNPPIGRLDHFYFQWVNVVGDTIDNNDCDWSATAVITENTAMATTASTIPALPPMPPLRK